MSIITHIDKFFHNSPGAEMCLGTPHSRAKCRNAPRQPPGILPPGAHTQQRMPGSARHPYAKQTPSRSAGRLIEATGSTLRNLPLC